MNRTFIDIYQLDENESEWKREIMDEKAKEWIREKILHVFIGVEM